MKLRVTFGISSGQFIHDLILLGLTFPSIHTDEKWFEIHILGFRFFFYKEESC